jgi:NTP pyrophosphatase (non-canonical NTP hydrolase)
MGKGIAIREVQEYVKSKGIWKFYMEDKNAWLLKFMEESGELAKAILQNYPRATGRVYENTLDEEFGDVLFCLCAIANLYDVDIEKWFIAKQQDIDAQNHTNYFSNFFGNEGEHTSISPGRRDTWDEFDKLVDEIDEKLEFEDFLRSDLSRPLVDFDEVRA